MDIYKVCLNTADTSIFVAVNGNDSVNDGSFDSPYASINKAVSMVTTAKPNVIVMPGSYTLSAAIDITVSGTKIIGIGQVDITGPVGGDYCFKTVFGTAKGTKSVTFKNLNIDHDDDATQVGIQLINTGATAKVNCYIDDVSFGSDGGNSIDIDNLVNGQAIRCYCTRCTTEGPVNIVVKDNGDRFRFSYGNLRGGLVSDAGDYDAEILIAWSTHLLNGITGGHANQRVIFAASISETDADPNVYLESVAADVETQTAQVIAHDAP